MEIAQNRRFENITQIMLGGDHYKWRLIRLNGEDEKLVTGNETGDRDKFLAFARVLPNAIGNPIYHWTHLELRRYFGIDMPLTEETACEIWEKCNKKLMDEDMSARGIIEKSRVDAIATTDDPLDSLEWHKMIAEDKSFSTRVVPTFRPDKAVNIDKPGFAEYIDSLGKTCAQPIKNLDDLFAAIKSRMDHFSRSGCFISDHGLEQVPFALKSESAAPVIFEKSLSGCAISDSEAERYKTALMLFFGREYAKRGWAMQLHCGAMRSINTPMYEKLGADAGYDAIGGYDCGKNIARLLDALEQTDALPKTVLYSLNPNDDAVLVTIAACFPGSGIKSKIQHGSAWWFNDTKQGMESQLANLAAKGLLGGFVGMLTDSRSFLSYTRHEYFRRILCNLLGGWMENGEYFSDMETLGEIVRNISYNNAVKYFGFKFLAASEGGKAYEAEQI
jgi:glucuronate isomerase